MMKKREAENFRTRAKSKPRFLLGFASGAVGGLAGAAAAVAMEQLSAPRGAGNSLRLREAKPWRSDGVQQTAATRQGIHWAVGALAGGVYGMAAEVWPQVTKGNGAVLGVVVDVAKQEAPALQGLLTVLYEQSPLTRIGDITAHAAYGVTAEFVRKHMRSWLESRDRKDGRDAVGSAGRNVNLKLTA